MEGFVFPCPECGFRLRAEAAADGAIVHCFNCGRRVEVPAQVPPVLEQARGTSAPRPPAVTLLATLQLFLGASVLVSFAIACVAILGGGMRHPVAGPPPAPLLNRAIGVAPLLLVCAWAAWTLWLGIGLLGLRESARTGCRLWAFLTAIPLTLLAGLVFSADAPGMAKGIVALAYFPFLLYVFVLQAVLYNPHVRSAFGPR